jgi:Zn-dependent alcohol dehydrogenase
MSVTARIAVLRGSGGLLAIEEVVLPEPLPHQVVVRQYATGICHTQLHQMHGHRGGSLLLGHESTGVVLAAGAEVTAAQVGDKVVVTWIPCRPLAGRAIEQPGIVLGDGSRPRVSNGVFTWADHTVIDEVLISPLPADAPADVASVVGCAVMTGAGAVIRTAGVTAGQSVAVFGVGGVGVSAIGAAAVSGASPIIAVDLDPEKLELARRFGATHLIDATQEDAVKAIRAITRRDGEVDLAGRPVEGVDFAFDCIGARQTMQQILDAVRYGRSGDDASGTAILVGMPQGSIELDTKSIFRGKGYRGSIAGGCVPDRDFPIFLDWHAAGLFDLAALVTARYPLDEINVATTALAEGKVLGRAVIEFDYTP